MSGRLHAKTKPRAASRSAPARTAPRRPAGRSTPPSRTRRTSTASGRTPPASRPTARAAATVTAGRASAVRTPSQRAAVVTRRNRFRLVVAAAVALAILVTSFPLTVLYGQHRQLSAAGAQLAKLTHQNALLSEQRQQLDSNAEVKRLAQQDYQLVAPGRSLFVILPPAGQATPAGASSAGDPADQPLVSPADAPDMSPDPGLPQSTAVSSSSTATAPGGSARSAATHTPAGFWSRVTGSLEFWK